MLKKAKKDDEKAELAEKKMVEKIVKTAFKKAIAADGQDG